MAGLRERPEIVTTDDFINDVDPATEAKQDVGNALLSGLSKTEDALHVSGDKGIMPLSVRNDAGTALAGDGDYAPLQTDSSGALRVTGGGGGTEYTVNNAAPADPVGATFVMERDDQLATLAEAEGDWTQPRSSSKGALWVTIPDSNGDPITSFGGGTQYTEDVAAAADPIGTAEILIRQDTPATLTTTDGDNVARRGTNYGAAYTQIVTSAGAFVDTFGGGQQYADAAARGTATGTLAMGDDGTNIQSVHVDTSGDLQIDVLTMPTTTVTATDLDIRNLVFATDKVDVSGSTVTVTGGATEATLASLLTSSQLIDDTVTVLGTDTYTEASSKGITIGAVRRDADTTLVGTTNEFAPLQVDANGRLKVEVFSGETLPVSLASTTITGTVAVTQSGTWDEVGINDSGNSITVDAPIGTPVNVQIGNATLAAGVIDETGAAAVDALAVGGGTAHDAVDSGNPLKIGGRAQATAPTSVSADGDRVNAWFLLNGAQATVITAAGALIGGDAANGLDVDVTRLPALVAGSANIGGVDVLSVIPGTAATNLGKAEDGAHTTGDVGVMALAVANEANTAFAADGDYVPTATDTEGNSRIVGNRDHDAVDAGEVVKVGGVAVSGSATPTSVAAADRVRWIFNQHGIPYVMGGHPNLITREYDFGTAAQTDVNLAAAAVAADERIYVTRFEATCDNANTVAVSVRAGFGTVSVPTASATGVSGMIGSHPGIAAGSGLVSGSGAGVIAVGGAGEEPRLTSSAATSGNLHVIISYYLVDETP